MTAEQPAPAPSRWRVRNAIVEARQQRLADAQAALDAAGYGGGPHDAAIRAMAAERDRLAGASEQLDEIAAMVDAAPRGASAEQLAIVLRAIRDVATAALGGASDAG